MRLAESAFVVALLFYSIAIWSHYLGKRTAIREWIVLLFFFALVIDLWGTIFVCAKASPTTVWDFHTITGFASLGIMAIPFAWASYAWWYGDHRTQVLFSRYSPYAWSLWLTSFLTGIPWSKLAAAP